MNFDKSVTPALCAIVFLVLVLIPPAGLAAEGDTLVFLIRHAEKIDESRDPGLSEAGIQRSRELARVLRDAGIQRIHSTDYIRTRDTVAPLADMLGLKVEIYDWDDPADFARSLKLGDQRHLVVGHLQRQRLDTLLGHIRHCTHYPVLLSSRPMVGGACDPAGDPAHTSFPAAISHLR